MGFAANPETCPPVPSPHHPPLPFSPRPPPERGARGAHVTRRRRHGAGGRLEVAAPAAPASRRSRPPGPGPWLPVPTGGRRGSCRYRKAMAGLPAPPPTLPPRPATRFRIRGLALWLAARWWRGKRSGRAAPAGVLGWWGRTETDRQTDRHHLLCACSAFKGNVLDIYRELR